MTTPTPETDAAVVEASQYYQPLYPSANGRNQPVHAEFARKLERERDEIQNELNKCATQLVATINDRNFLGVQLDLIRDELLRISARIGETGLLNEHPGLRSIFDYCERAQKDIAVNYTPIQERDAWKEKASQLERERDELQTALSTALRERESARQNISTAAGKLVQSIAERDEWKNNYQTAYDEWQQSAVDRDAWKAKAERTCKWTFSRRSQITGRCDSGCGSKDAMVWLYDPKFGYVFCPFCGGRIVKEGE